MKIATLSTIKTFLLQNNLTWDLAVFFSTLSLIRVVNLIDKWKRTKSTSWRGGTPSSVVVVSTFCFWRCLVFWNKMLLQISPSLRHVTVLPGKGLKEFIKVKVASRKLSYRMLFYSLLFFTFLLRFVFVLTAVDNIDGANKCSSIGTLSVSLSFTHTHTQSHKHKNTCMHIRNT